MEENSLMKSLELKESIPCLLNAGDEEIQIKATFGVGDEDCWLYLNLQSDERNFKFDINLMFGDERLEILSELPEKLRHLADKIEANIDELRRERE